MCDMMAPETTKISVKESGNSLVFWVITDRARARYEATTAVMDAAGAVFLATVGATPIRGWRRRLGVFLMAGIGIVLGMGILAVGLALAPMFAAGVVVGDVASHMVPFVHLLYYTPVIVVIPAAIWFLCTAPLWREVLTEKIVGIRGRRSRVR